MDDPYALDSEQIEEVRQRVAQQIGAPAHFLHGTTRAEIEKAAAELTEWEADSPLSRWHRSQNTPAERLKADGRGRESARQRALAALSGVRKPSYTSTSNHPYRRTH